MDGDSYGYKFLAGLNRNMATTVRELYSPLMESFSGFAFTIVALWVALIGYLFIKGKLKEAGESLFISSLILVVIAGIVFTPSLYAEWIYQPLIQTVMKLSSFLVTPTGETSLRTLFVNLDERFSEVFGYIEALSDEGGFTNITPVIFSITMGIIFAALYAIFILFMAIGFFGMNVMLVFGGIFLFFAPFKSSRFLFTSWLRALANYSLIPVFTALVMAVTLTFIESAFRDLAAQDTTDLWSMEVANALLVGALGIFFHMKASEFAAAITGGSPAGMMGILAAAPMVGGALRGAIGGVMNASGASKGLQSFGNKLGSARDAAFSGLANMPARAYSRLRGLNKE